jgi:hypothetical protein
MNFEKSVNQDHYSQGVLIFRKTSYNEIFEEADPPIMCWESKYKKELYIQSNDNSYNPNTKYINNTTRFKRENILGVYALIGMNGKMNINGIISDPEMKFELLGLPIYEENDFTITPYDPIKHDDNFLFIQYFYYGKK